MSVWRKIIPTVVIVSSCAFPALALEKEECLERFKPIDERIASGDFPAQNVQIAQKARVQMLQACPFLDEDTFAQMLASMDELLPTGTDAEIEARREATRQERRAERKRQSAELEAKRAAKEAARPKATELPLSAVLKTAPTGKSTVARFIDRDDAMAMVDVLDHDRFDGKTRLLYIARPSRVQFRLPSAMDHYYVVEAAPNGEISQRHIVEFPLERTVTAALRSGHDEIIFQYPVDPPRPGTRFERWSISDARMVGSSDAPALPWSGRKWSQDRDHFDLATSDGNVLFVAVVPGPAGRQSVSWLKASPNGAILGHGNRSVEAGSAMTQSWFHTRNGGGGVVLELVASADTGISSDLDTPLTETIDGVQLEGNVFSEQRLLIVGSDGKIGWESPGLARSFVWRGLDVLGQRGSLSVLEQASAATARRGADHGANNSVVLFSAAGGRPGAIGPIGEAFGVFIKENDAPGANGTIDRHWLVEFLPDRSSKRTDLTAAARHFDARFVMLDAPGEDTVYLYTYGRRGSAVVLLNGARDIAAHAAVTMSPSIIPNVMVADVSGVWVAGEGRPDGSNEAVWLERLEFGQTR